MKDNFSLLGLTAQPGLIQPALALPNPRMPRPQPIFRGRIAAQVQRRRRACAPVALLVQRGSHLTEDHTCRSTIMRLISAIALAGLRLFGQALAQFMMVWQRCT